MNATTNLLDNAIALSINITKIGTRRKVKSNKVQLREGEGEQPEEKAIAVSKELISCSSFDAIIELDNKFRNKLYKLALPNPLFRNGTYLIPMSLVEDIDSMINAYRFERNIKVDLFLRDYSGAVYDARRRLGGLFNENDYPDNETVKSSFTVTAQYIEIGIPSALGTISPEIFKREQQEFNNKLVSAAEEITAAMRESFKELIDHMVERLKPDESGKPKIFRDTLVNNLREFMDTFNSRNITNDEELEKLVNKARSVLNGKSANDLRNMDSIRNQVASGMDEVKTLLSDMVTDAPKRKFSFDD